jgi:hypothetical protein
MYRIELKSGEETVFRTIEELATGIRNGLVTPRARIFHAASQKWLPIEFHPHYKKALNMPATKSGETLAVVVPSAPAPVSIFTPKPAPAPAVTPAPRAAPEPAPVVVAAPVMAPPVVVAPAVVSPVASLPPVTYDRPVVGEAPLPVAHAPLSRTDAGLFRPLYLAIAAAVLLIGSYMALSAAAPSRMASAADTQAAQPAAMQTATPDPVVAAQRIDSSQPRASVAIGTSGPTFGPTASPPIARKRTMMTSIGASPPAPAAKDSAVAIEPAPADVDLSVPSLPLGESLAPAVQTNSNAIRGILRAVSGEGAPDPRP